MKSTAKNGCFYWASLILILYNFVWVRRQELYVFSGVNGLGLKAYFLVNDL